MGTWPMYAATVEAVAPQTHDLPDTSGTHSPIVRAPSLPLTSFPGTRMSLRARTTLRATRWERGRV